MADPSPDIILERSLYYGIVFMSICYGLLVYMYAHSLVSYLKSSKSDRRLHTTYIVFATVSLSLCTIAVFVNVVFMQFMWIDHRDVEGGPFGYFVANNAIWFQVFGTAASQVQNFMADGLLLYRCYLIWTGNWLVVSFPILLYLASIAMALVTLVQSALPGSQFFRGLAVNFGVPWTSLSVSLNVFVTALIITRLMVLRQNCKGLLPRDTLNMYTGVSALLIESALPFSVLGIVFAITYGKNLSVGPAFAFLWGTFSAISPQFIIFRVTTGKSWTRDPMTHITTGITDTIKFKPGEFPPSYNGNKMGGSTTFLDPSVPRSTEIEIEMEKGGKVDSVDV
ncbi:unnamed protein product [Cyclocybe aegerita]|uniref:Uncharacterized protein n=1 Tax=Cyclocybe aegerita TaxID=1973307 RepID=A0A8S0XZR1_CYCAE|nr:unnamed protein product [Cyclocybe aegerita]